MYCIDGLAHLRTPMSELINRPLVKRLTCFQASDTGAEGMANEKYLIVGEDDKVISNS